MEGLPVQIRVGITVLDTHILLYILGDRKTTKATFRDGRECKKGIQNGENVGLTDNRNVTEPSLFSDVSPPLFCNHI
jgi:hypothetical protein